MTVPNSVYQYPLGIPKSISCTTCYIFWYLSLSFCKYPVFIEINLNVQDD